MSEINFRDDKQDSIKAVANPQELASKVNELKDLQDEIANAEESIKKLKEKEKIISQFEIPSMMDQMNIKKLKLKDGESVEVETFIAHLFFLKNRKKLLTGFVKTVEVMLLKMTSLLPSARARTTRQWLMLPLRKVKDTNLSRK